MTSTLMARYQQLRDEVRQRTEEIATIGREAFHEMAQAVFVDHPILKAFRWAQYTPYFNDGDECTFSVREPHYRFSEVDEGNDNVVEEEDDWVSVYTWRYRDTPVIEPTPQIRAALAVEAFIGQFEQEDLQMFLGDHIEVVITRDGVATEDYYHE